MTHPELRALAIGATIAIAQPQTTQHGAHSHGASHSQTDFHEPRAPTTPSCRSAEEHPNTIDYCDERDE